MSTATVPQPAQGGVCDPGQALLDADRAVQNSRDPFPELTLGDALTPCTKPRSHYFNPPTAGDGDGSASLAWPGMTAGVTAVVSGGTYAVDTDALSDFATALTNAAGYLDDARAHALDAESEAQDAVARPEPDKDTSDSQGGGSFFSEFHWSDPMCTSGFGNTGIASCSGPSSYSTSSFETLRTAALDAVAALTTGPGSLQDVADSLRALASDVMDCVSVYNGAESGAAAAPSAWPPGARWGYS